MKVVRGNAEVVEMSFEEREGKEAFWHTGAHMLAQAVGVFYGPKLDFHLKDSIGRTWQCGING